MTSDKTIVLPDKTINYSSSGNAPFVISGVTEKVPFAIQFIQEGYYALTTSLINETLLGTSMYLQNIDTNILVPNLYLLVNFGFNEAIQF